MCGVDADVDRAASPATTRTTRPAAIRTLIGAEHHENGAMFYRTLACLPALIGAWRDRGGGLLRSVGSWQDRARRRRRARAAPTCSPGALPRTLNMSRLGEILTDEQLDRRCRR